MALGNAWSFANESGALLASDMGWTFSDSSTNAIAVVSSPASKLWSYNGSPARYSLGVADDVQFSPPASFQPGTNLKGAWAFPMRLVSGVSIDNWCVHNDTSIGSTYIRTASSSTLALYVRGVLVGTSQTLDLSNWHYICLKSDMSANPWTGELWVDGVQEASGSTAIAAATNSIFYMRGCGTNPLFVPADGMLIGHLLYYTDPATDDAETPRYCTSVEFNADGPENGTWTPGGTGPPADNHSAVNTPLDTATYTQNASPSSGHDVELEIDGTDGVGGTDDLETHLGIQPPNITAVVLHTWSSGQALNARAIITDGTEAAGASTAIDAVNTTYAYKVQETKPTGGGAWAHTDQPRGIYEIV